MKRTRGNERSNRKITMTSSPELLILAPEAPDKVYTDCIRTFVDSGVWFPFGNDYALPRDLPDTLAGFLCVGVDVRST